jgi:hypothetical protein
MDLRQVLYPPQPQLRGDDNLAIQLNSVTKQLQDLQDKQQNRTANLMAGARAIAREEGAQGSVMEEVAMPPPPPKAKRTPKLKVVETPKPVAEPEPVSSLSPEPSVTRGRKKRSDAKGPGSRQTMRSASLEALKRGYALTAVKTGAPLPTIIGGNTPEPGLSAATSTSGGMVFN